MPFIHSETVENNKSYEEVSMIILNEDGLPPSWERLLIGFKSWSDWFIYWWSKSPLASRHRTAHNFKKFLENVQCTRLDYTYSDDKWDYF